MMELDGKGDEQRERCWDMRGFSERENVSKEISMCKAMSSVHGSLRDA